MKEYNEANWKEALDRVFQRAATDPIYRDLCLSEPKVAIAEVSDIELSADFDVHFSDTPVSAKDTYMLPPFVGAAAPADDPDPTDPDPTDPGKVPTVPDPRSGLPRTH